MNKDFSMNNLGLSWGVNIYKNSDKISSSEANPLQNRNEINAENKKLEVDSAVSIEISEDGMNKYLQFTSDNSYYEDSGITTRSTRGKYMPISNGEVLTIPKPGKKITVSLGTDKKSIRATVTKTNAWAIEFSIKEAERKCKGGKCGERLASALDKFKYNKDEEDLLKFKIPKLGTCYAGAMIDGFGEIGDIAEVTLDNGKKFNFMLLDTKSNKHESKDLIKSNQCQNEWGHGYMFENNTKVQLNICEFIISKRKEGAESAKLYKSGEFLKNRYVKRAKIIGHVNIE